MTGPWFPDCVIPCYLISRPCPPVTIMSHDICWPPALLATDWPNSASYQFYRHQLDLACCQLHGSIKFTVIAQFNIDTSLIVTGAISEIKVLILYNTVTVPFRHCVRKYQLWLLYKHFCEKIYIIWLFTLGWYNKNRDQIYNSSGWKKYYMMNSNTLTNLLAYMRHPKRSLP